MKSFLHVGCGPKRKDRTTRGFNWPEWDEIRLDIDPSAQPVVISTMTNLSDVASESEDAIYSSHNIEQLYPHEVPLAFAEFIRVSGTLQFCGFKTVVTMARGRAPFFDLFALASKSERSDAEMRDLASLRFPG